MKIDKLKANSTHKPFVEKKNSVMTQTNKKTDKKAMVRDQVQQLMSKDNGEIATKF